VQLRLLPSEESLLPRLPRPLWSVPLRLSRAGLLDLLAGQLRQLASSAFAPQLATVNGDQLQLSAGDARVLDWSTVAALQCIRPAGCETIELRYALGETAATGIARLHAEAQGAKSCSCRRRAAGRRGCGRTVRRKETADWQSTAVCSRCARWRSRRLAAH